MSNVMAGRMGVVWSAINNWTNTLLSFITIALLARLIPPEAFGVVGLATIFIALCQVFLTDTISTTLVQRAALDDEHLQAAFWVSLAIGIATCGLAIVLAPLTANFFAEPRLKFILQVISSRLIFDSLAVVPTAILTKKLDFRLLTRRSLVANIVGGAGGILLAAMEGSVWALVLQQVLNAAVTSGVLFYSVQWRPRLLVSLRHARDLLPYSSYMIATRSFTFLNSYVDRILIGHYMDVTAVGFFSFARRIHDMSTASLSGVISSVCFPLFASKQHDSSALSQSVLKVTNLTSIATFPVFVGLSCTTPDLVPLLFGDAWIPAVPLVQIFSLTGILYNASAIHMSVILGVGRSDWWSAYVAFSSSLNIIAFICTVRYGIVAMATSSAIMAFVLTPIQLAMVRRLIDVGLKEYLSIYFAPLAASIGMAAVVLSARNHWLISHSSPWRVPFEIAIGAISYFILVVLLAPQRIKELLAYASSLKAS